jgi:hypothetical protein
MQLNVRCRPTLRAATPFLAFQVDRALALQLTHPLDLHFTCAVESYPER